MALLSCLWVVTVVLPLVSDCAIAKEAEFYTVIAGSYPSAEVAEKDFSVINAKLAGPQKDHLRIEMVGGYATIRVGKFTSKAQADELAGHVRRIARFEKARVLSAYYRPARIVKLFRGQGKAADSVVAGEDQELSPAISTEVLPANMASEPFVEESLGGQVGPDEIVNPKEPESAELVDEGAVKLEEKEILPKDSPAVSQEGIRFKAIGSLAEADLGVISEIIGEPYGPALALEAQKKEGGGEGAARGGAQELVRQEKLTYDVVAILDKDDRGEDIRMPSAVFFDRVMEELYLVSGISKRIVVYGSDYFAQNSIGSGRGVGAPLSGAVDKQGNIYITQVASEAGPTRLTILNSAFLPKRDVTLEGIPNSGGFIFQKVAIAKDGSIYVTGIDSERVLVLDASGNFKKWTSIRTNKLGDYLDNEESSEPGISAKIKDIAVDSLGNLIFLSEANSRIYVFTSDEKFLFSFGKKGGAAGKMSRPRGIAIDEEKRCFYVVDYMRHTILVFDFAGTFRHEFGGRGWGPEWFNYPIDLTLGRHGQLIVADLFNQRAQVFEVRLPEVLPERSPDLWGGGGGKGEK